MSVTIFSVGYCVDRHSRNSVSTSWTSVSGAASGTTGRGTFRLLYRFDMKVWTGYFILPHTSSVFIHGWTSIRLRSKKCPFDQSTVFYNFEKEWSFFGICFVLSDIKDTRFNSTLGVNVGEDGTKPRTSILSPFRLSIVTFPYSPFIFSLLLTFSFFSKKQQTCFVKDETQR